MIARRPGRSRGRGAAGFTLLELIVAAGILALIAVFSWRGLDSLIREREAIAASQETIDLLQRSFARIERDALLANDVQVDDDGTMRFVAGSSTDGADDPSSSTVEYRLVNGTLTRTVGGGAARPLAMIDGIVTLSIEAWAPGPRGGAWVRVKGAATESTAPVAPGNSAGANNAATNASNAANGSGAAAPNASAGQDQDVNVPSSTRLRQQAAATRAGQNAPVVPAATGIRFSFARGDGARVVRSFIVGGA